MRSLFSFLFFTQALLMQLYAKTPTAADFDKIFSQWNKSTSPGAVLLVIKDNKVVYKKGYGMARLDKNQPLSPNSVLDLASTSKQFTAFCIALLIENQQLALSDDIRNYFPELPPMDKGVVRVEHLIYHTSGLPDYLDLMYDYLGKDDYDWYSVEDVLGLLAQVNKLQFSPGKSFDYSNTNYLLLGELVKRVSGKSLRQFAHENIFEPLGMKNSHFHDNYEEKVPNLAYGYARKGTNFKADMTILDLVGDGNLYTTAEDLYLWDKNFYNNKLGAGAQSLINLTIKPGKLSNGQKLDYAFGLEISKYLGHRMISHDGSFVGYESALMRFPDDHLTIIVLANLNSIDPTELALDVADLFLLEF